MLPRAEQLLLASVKPYVDSILEALMEPTSRGFSEVRDVFSRELVEVSKNTLNGGGKELLGEVGSRLIQYEIFYLCLSVCRSIFPLLYIYRLMYRSVPLSVGQSVFLCVYLSSICVSANTCLSFPRCNLGSI